LLTAGLLIEANAPGTALQDPFHKPPAETTLRAASRYLDKRLELANPANFRSYVVARIDPANERGRVSEIGKSGSELAGRRPCRLRQRRNRS
jgi:hypothetical protein